MHSVSKIDEAAAQTLHLYGRHSIGFRRATYVDHSAGPVHMGVGIGFLESKARSRRTSILSFEESLYILEGNPVAQIGEKSYTLAVETFLSVFCLPFRSFSASPQHQPWRATKINNPKMTMGIRAMAA